MLKVGDKVIIRMTTTIDTIVFIQPSTYFEQQIAVCDYYLAQEGGPWIEKDLIEYHETNDILKELIDKP